MIFPNKWGAWTSTYHVSRYLDVIMCSVFLPAFVKILTSTFELRILGALCQNVMA